MQVSNTTYQLKTNHSRRWIIAPTWYPDEALSKPNENGERELLPRNERKLRSIPPLNRKVYNTIEKHGPWINAKWPCLVMRLIDAGMRKRNLSFRPDHKQNIENTLRWIAYNSDAVTGCINVAKLCVEIGKDISVSSSTISVIMKELCVMGILSEPEYSGGAIQDVLHGGCLPRTLCATPLYYELMGIKLPELQRMQKAEIKRRKDKAAEQHELYDSNAALRKYCQDNVLRVWEHRHSQDNSSYKVKLRDMEPLERMTYISKKLVQRIKDKGWDIDLGKVPKMANNLLSRMGLAVRASELKPPVTTL